MNQFLKEIKIILSQQSMDNFDRNDKVKTNIVDDENDLNEYFENDFNESYQLFQNTNESFYYTSNKFNFDSAIITPISRKDYDGSNNYFTDILNLTKTWEYYPDRNKSLLLYTKPTQNDDSVYRVFPINDSIVAICPKNESYYTSFRYMNNETNIPGMSKFNKTFDELCFSNNINRNDLIKAIKEIENKVKHKVLKKTNSLGNYFIQELQYDKYTIEKSLKVLFSPENNGFNMIKITSSQNIPNEDHECWTDQPCLFVKSNILE